MASLLALLAISVVADNVDLPVATQGTEQWSGVLANAMTMGGRDQDASLQALQSFQDKVFAKIAKTVRSRFLTQLDTANGMSFLLSSSSVTAEQSFKQACLYVLALACYATSCISNHADHDAPHANICLTSPLRSCAVKGV